MLGGPIVPHVPLPRTRGAEQTMAMPASARRRWTRAEVIALIDANPFKTPRYELVDGELLVTPSPGSAHQAAVRELMVELSLYLRVTPVGEVFDSPFDVEVERETLTQPDVFVVPRNEGKRLRSEMPARALLLAIEVISPSSGRHDRGPKRALYQRHVPEYWIVDLDARLVERWRPNDDRPEILYGRVSWQPEGAETPFVLDLDPFFARVFGEDA
jgi:Uma2 family endonuclease